MKQKRQYIPRDLLRQLYPDGYRIKNEDGTLSELIKHKEKTKNTYKVIRQMIGPKYTIEKDEMYANRRWIIKDIEENEIYFIRFHRPIDEMISQFKILGTKEFIKKYKCETHK